MPRKVNSTQKLSVDKGVKVFCPPYLVESMYLVRLNGQNTLTPLSTRKKGIRASKNIAQV